MNIDDARLKRLTYVEPSTRTRSAPARAAAPVAQNFTSPWQELEADRRAPITEFTPVSPDDPGGIQADKVAFRRNAESLAHPRISPVGDRPDLDLARPATLTPSGATPLTSPVPYNFTPEELANNEAPVVDVRTDLTSSHLAPVSDIPQVISLAPSAAMTAAKKPTARPLAPTAPVAAPAAGAGIGLLLGGPVGAIIGGVAGLLLAKKA